MLPQTPESRNKLLKYINQSVGILKEIDVLREDAKNVGDLVKEELQVSAKDYGALVKVAYDQSKVEEEIETRQTAISNVSILKGE